MVVLVTLDQTLLTWSINDESERVGAGWSNAHTPRALETKTQYKTKQNNQLTTAFGFKVPQIPESSPEWSGTLPSASRSYFVVAEQRCAAATSLLQRTILLTANRHFYIDSELLQYRATMYYLLFAVQWTLFVSSVRCVTLICLCCAHMSYSSVC